MGSVLDWLERLMLGIGLAGMVVLFLDVLLGVLDRYVLQASLSWTGELARYTLVWTSFAGAAALVRRKQHIMLALLPELLSRRAAAGLSGLVALAIAGFLGIFVYYGAVLTQRVSFQSSPSLGISMSWVYAAAPVCGLVMMIFALASFVFYVREVLAVGAPGDSGNDTGEAR